MPQTVTVEKQWEADEDREDMLVALSDYEVGPGNIQYSKSVTIGWSIQGDVSIAFSPLNLSLGGNYTESHTATINYQLDIAAGETPRLIYVPKMHHINGWITITEGGDIIPNPSGGPSEPTQIITVTDHQWVALYFPLPEQGTFARQDKDGRVENIMNG